MPISEEMAAAIRRMFYAEHHRVESIAKHFNIHHSTVSRAINQNFKRPAAGSYKLSIFSPSHQRYAEDRLEKYPRITAKKIYEELKERGYLGSINTVRRKIRNLRRKYQRAFVPLEVIAGEEAQVDWAHIGQLNIDGAERKIYLFAMTLSWSRASWLDITFDMTSENLLRCHSSAFAYFDGVPRRVLYDNMRTVVAERSGTVIRFNKTLLEYASWYCYEPRVCDPYQPQQKGRVERFIRTFREGFLNGYELNDINQARYDLRLWLFAANSRSWPGSSDATIDSKLEEERQNLMQLPNQLWPMGEKQVKAGKVPLIKFDLNQYSIWPKFVGQALTVFFDDESVRILAGDEEAGRHKRCWGRSQVIQCGDHLDALFARAGSGQKVALFRHVIQSEIPQVEDVLQWCQAQDISLSQVLRTMVSLRQDFGRKTLKIAISKAVEQGRPTPEMIGVICRKMAKESKIEPAGELLLPDRRGVSDMIIKSHDLSGYDEL